MGPSFSPLKGGEGNCGSSAHVGLDLVDRLVGVATAPSGANLTKDSDRLLSVAPAQAGVQGKRPVPAAPCSSQGQALGSCFRGHDEEVRDGC